MKRKMTKYDNNKSVTGNAFSPAENYHFDILLRVEGLHSARWIIMIGHPKFAKKNQKFWKHWRYSCDFLSFVGGANLNRSGLVVYTRA